MSEDKYHKIMALLLNSRMTHGQCLPRERRSCTHCNAIDDINKMIDDYKGPQIYLSGT